MKRAIKRLLAGILALSSVFACACASPEEIPENQTDTNIQWNDTDEELVTTKGIATNLTLSIGGGEGAVWAKVRNNFTLLPSTIWVFVELYSSQTYQESYTSMTREKIESVKDLDIGKSITISVPTGGAQKYWQARMRYKFDNRDWVTKCTSTFLYSANGEVIDEPQPPEPPTPMPMPETNSSAPFYSLQTAYYRGWLTQEDLQSIFAYHTNSNVKPPELSEDIAQKIKDDWVKNYKAQHDTSEEISATLLRYYGTYNGASAVMIERTGSTYITLYAPISIEVGGVTFIYGNTALPQIVIYNPNPNASDPKRHGAFYSLQDAYGEVLTRENLQAIADYNNNGEVCPEKLDETTARLIKEYAANAERNREKFPVLDAKAEDFEILRYYGVYDGGYAVVLNTPYDDYPADVRDEWVTIGGVNFHYMGYYSIVIWRLSGEIDKTHDMVMLNNSHEPTIDEKFEDNKVWVILKSEYNDLTKISFADFAATDQVSEMVSFHYKLEDFGRGDIINLRKETNHMFCMELATHDKQKVLDVIDKLMKLDMVLIASPSYIYDAVFDRQILSLEDAYENDLLSEENLKSIADYYNNPDTRPNDLSEDTRETINTAFCKQFGITDYDKAGVPSTYFGTYSGCTVVQISTTCDSEFGGDPICYTEYTIGGVTFYRYSPLMVYRKI
ncbi:MAG: hypothetical protein K2L12_03780 [Clostridia bacterium]|nr:hypothetical protein [Clostridia bacterium]